jgi:hypothetical protein
MKNCGRGPKLSDKSQNNMKAGNRDGAAPLRKSIAITGRAVDIAIQSH